MGESADTPDAHGTSEGSRNAALERARSAKKSKQLPPVNFETPETASGSGGRAHAHESTMQIPYEKFIPGVRPMCQKRRSSKEMPTDPSDPSLLTPLKQLRLWLVGQQQPRWRPASVPAPVPVPAPVLVPGPEGLDEIFVTRRGKHTYTSKRSARSRSKAEADWDAWEDDCVCEMHKENGQAVTAE